MIRKFTITVTGFLLLAILILFAWYQIDGQPLAETQQYLASNRYSIDISDDGSLLFLPASANGYGVLIMHGALIKPQSYAKTAAFFAERGYTVLLPYGFARLSITAIRSTAARMREMELQKWFVIGHSMGGLSSMMLVSGHDLPVKAVALWASAIPTDYSKSSLPILMLWGDNDGLVPAERFQASQQNLPASARFVTVKGGNHQNFAMYSHQFFDAEAKISWREQIDFANRETARFFVETVGVRHQSPGF